LLFEVAELNLVKPNEKGGKAMASQILVTSNSEDRLNPMIPYMEKIAQPGRWWFAVAIFLSFFFMVGFALMRPDFNRQEIPDWRPVLALADASLGKGELYAQEVHIHELPGWHPGGKIGGLTRCRLRHEIAG
jgi:hypothetical protein